MSTKDLTIFVALGVLVVSACRIVVPQEKPASTMPKDAVSSSVELIEDIPNQLVPVLGHDQARNVIVKYLADHYGLTLPVEWKFVDQTQADLVGSSKSMFVGDLWTVIVSAPVIAPEYLVYQIEVSDLASGLQWLGTVDAFGTITEESVTPPVSVASTEDARDLAVKLVAENQNLEIPMEWVKQSNKFVGNYVLETYTGGPWVVQVSYISSAPFVGEYQVVIDHLQAVIRWQGKVDAHGNPEGYLMTDS